MRQTRQPAKGEEINFVRPQSHHDSPYRFFTVPGASVQLRLASSSQGRPELQVFGNRAGLLSLANVLLWFLANASRREFLSLGDLPFVHEEGSLSVCIRMTMEDRDMSNRLSQMPVHCEVVKGSRPVILLSANFLTEFLCSLIEQFATHGAHL